MYRGDKQGIEHVFGESPERDRAPVPPTYSTLLLDVGRNPNMDAALSAVEVYRPNELDIQVALSAPTKDQTSLRSATLILLGERLSDGSPCEDVLGPLRKHLPHVGLFVVGTSNGVYSNRLLALVRMGADELYTFDEAGEHERFFDHVRRRLEVPPPEAALRTFRRPESTPDRVMQLAQWLLRNAYRNPSLDDAGAHFGHHATTLWRWLRTAELPHPSTILRCGRLLHVARLRHHQRLSYQEIANRLGMDAAASVRMMLSRAAHDKQLYNAFNRLGMDVTLVLASLQ